MAGKIALAAKLGYGAYRVYKAIRAAERGRRLAEAARRVARASKRLNLARKTLDRISKNSKTSKRLKKAREAAKRADEFIRRNLPKDAPQKGKAPMAPEEGFFNTQIDYSTWGQDDPNPVSGAIKGSVDPKGRREFANFKMTKDLVTTGRADIGQTNPQGNVSALTFGQYTPSSGEQRTYSFSFKDGIEREGLQEYPPEIQRYLLGRPVSQEEFDAAVESQRRYSPTFQRDFQRKKGMTMEEFRDKYMEENVYYR